MLWDRERDVRLRGVYRATERLWGQLALGGGGGWGMGEVDLCGRRGLWWGARRVSEKGAESGTSRQVRVKEWMVDAVG